MSDGSNNFWMNLKLFFLAILVIFMPEKKESEEGEDK